MPSVKFSIEFYTLAWHEAIYIKINTGFSHTMHFYISITISNSLVRFYSSPVSFFLTHLFVHSLIRLFFLRVRHMNPCVRKKETYFIASIRIYQ